MQIINRFLTTAVIVLFGVLILFSRYSVKLKESRDVYERNNYALLSDVTRLQLDSASTAVDVKVLQLSLNEYKRYRAEDLEQIRKMGVKIKNLEAVAKHVAEVNASFTSEITDTVVVRDTVLLTLQKIEVNTPFLQVDGIISDNRISGHIKLPVTLHQAVSLEYKHKFLWWQWRVKAIHQTIASDNPHVEINYSEMILIR